MSTEKTNDAFGDEYDTAADADRGNAHEQPRDDQGRFAAKDEKADDEAAGDEKLGGEAAAEQAAAKETSEGGANAEKDDDKDDDKQNFPIRLNKLKAQRDAEREARVQLEQELAALKAPKEQAPDPIDAAAAALDELYEKVEEARADGDTKLAAKLQRDIDAKNRDIARLESERVARKTSATSRIDAQYDAMVASLEQSVPQLNPGSDEFDPQLVAELEFQVGAYEGAGLDAVAALRRASALIFRKDLWAAQSVAPPAAEKPAAAPEKPPAKKPDIEKAVDSIRRQPPDASARGVNSEERKLNVRDLSDDDFAKLPESKKRELRGDFA